MKKVFVLFFLSSLILTSCGKYENGPKFTLLSKKARVANSWKVERTTFNEEPYQFNSNLYNNTFVFKNNFEYKILGEANQVQPAEQNGTWKFDNEKESIIIELDVISDTLIISKLKNKSMWLKSQHPGGVILYEYVPA